MDGVPWLNEREQRAWRAFQDMTMRLTGELNRRLHESSGLSDADYAVLVVLTDQPDERLRMFELAHAIGWEKSRLSHHISRMVKRGLVAKQPCGDDRRGAHVVLTDAGREAIEAAAPGHVRDVRELFVDVLTPRQLDAVRVASESVLRVLDEAPED